MGTSPAWRSDGPCAGDSRRPDRVRSPHSPRQTHLRALGSKSLIDALTGHVARRGAASGAVTYRNDVAEIARTRRRCRRALPAIARDQRREGMKTMAKKDYVVGTGNVFEDLGHSRPAEALAKAELARKIGALIGKRRLTRPQRPGLTTSERERLAALERENRELKRTNEILKTASAYFAQAALDRRSK